MALSECGDPEPLLMLMYAGFKEHFSSLDLMGKIDLTSDEKEKKWREISLFCERALTLAWDEISLKLWFLSES